VVEHLHVYMSHRRLLLLLLLLQVDDLRGSPLSVGSLEEIIDEK
jgi:hypothetical protein